MPRGMPTTHSLSDSVSQARVEKLLQQLLLEHQSGIRDGSVITVDSLESAEGGNDEAWRQIGRELEDVGITPDMIREHRHYIASWISNALRTGQFNDSAEHHRLPPTLPGGEVDFAAEEIVLRTTNSILEDNFRPSRKPGKKKKSERAVTPHIGAESSRRPGDVSLCETQLRPYICAHSHCKGRLDQVFTTWFEILIHARSDHSSYQMSWLRLQKEHSLGGNPDIPGSLCVDDWGKPFALSSPYSNIPLEYEHRDELAHVLTVLYTAVGNGGIPKEVPQLMYDLYYSTRCVFSDCQEVSKDDVEHRHV